MLDFIDLMSQIFYALTHPGSLFGSIFGVLALLCFGKFILGCQTGNWLLIIGGLFLTALFGFLAYKLLFSEN